MPLVEPDAYKGKPEDEIRLDVSLDGWAPQKLIHTADDIYEPHQHAEEKLLVILSGSMRLRIGRNWTTLLPGDKAIVPGMAEHEATMGKQGCTFFWAERLPDTDSGD